MSSFSRRQLSPYQWLQWQAPPPPPLPTPTAAPLLRSPHNSVWLSEAAVAAAGEGAARRNESLHWTEKFKTYWKKDKEKRRKEKRREEKRESEGEKSDGRILNVQFVSGGQNFTRSEKKEKKSSSEAKVWSRWDWRRQRLIGSFPPPPSIEKKKVRNVPKLSQLC